MRSTFIPKLLGANWRTTVSAILTGTGAAVTWLASVSYDTSPLALIIPPKYKTHVQYIAGIATVILWIYNGVQQKSKEVTGGSIVQNVDGKIDEIGTRQREMMDNVMHTAHRTKGFVYQPVVLALCLAALTVIVTLCSCVKDPHGKYYINGTAATDAQGNTSGSVTGGVEVNFVKKPSPTPSPPEGGKIGWMTP